MTFTLNRRSMLASMAASFTAATAGAAAQPQDDPDLTALGEALKEALGGYVAARDKVQAIEDEWGPQWPYPNLDIISYGHGCKTHRDIRGRGVETPWGNGGIMRVQQLGTPESFKADYERNKAEAERRSKFKSKRGMATYQKWAERDKARIAPARDYWAEVERIKAASGIDAAQATQTEALESLRDAVGQIMAYDTSVAAGLVLKAQALGAWGEVSDFYQKINPQAPEWMRGLTKTIEGVAS